MTNDNETKHETFSSNEMAARLEAAMGEARADNPKPGTEED